MKTYNIPVGKRLFDIAVSALLLFMLSPLFLVIAILIKLTSKGSVFYAAPRVGTGYQIFPFYKFRSMRQNADHLLSKYKDLNQYSNATEEVEYDIRNDSGVILMSDAGEHDEAQHLFLKQIDAKSSFVKINNDPRVTTVGQFIRNTSIDELPQLFNVLLGHMSIVGNRPLPLYEAEQLTADESVRRFMAPAGITGLWQVTERGKANTSDDSRKKLDVKYAETYNVWMDLKILFKTPLAMFQQENV